MSRLRVEALSERWARFSAEAEKAWTAYRESRLFLQTCLALILVGLAVLGRSVPAGPLATMRDRLAAAVTEDYDFRTRAEQAKAWADARGGWGPALSGVWRSSRERMESWTGIRRTGDTPPPSGVKEQPAPEPVREPVNEVPEPTPSAGGRPETIMPVSGPVLFGYGWLPRSKQVHEGLDLAAKVGEPVLAMAEGTVVRVSANESLGTFLEVDHGFAVILYGQVSGVKVKPGDAVRQGQTLAAVAKPTGQEGDSGVHLHLEVRPTRNAKTVDPAPYLPLEDLSQGGSGP